MVWLTARRDFTFKGTTYTAGQVFQVPPLVAVQMQVQRAVSYAKAPAQVPESAPTPSRRRRVYTTKQMSAEETATLTAPANEPTETVTLVNHNIDDPNLYARKDLRAED